MVPAGVTLCFGGRGCGMGTGASLVLVMRDSLSSSSYPFNKLLWWAGTAVELQRAFKGNPGSVMVECMCLRCVFRHKCTVFIM